MARRRQHIFEMEPLEETRYRDVLSRLTGRAWLAFVFVIALVFVTYLLGLWNRPSLFFLAVELPILVAVGYILSVNRQLKVTAPFLWAVTALGVWGYYSPTDLLTATVMKELLPAALTALTGYWLWQAVSGSRGEMHEAQADIVLAEALASLLTVWGATVQVAFVLLGPFEHLLGPSLHHSVIGSSLLDGLQLIHLGSPVAWIPTGFLALGLALYAIVRFSERPYVPMEYAEVLPLSGNNPLLESLFAAIRLPVWLVLLILGFLKHFIRITWESTRSFARRWLGRLVLIFTGLLAPAALLSMAHASLFVALEELGNYLGRSKSVASSLGTVLTVHVLFLLALALFVSAVAPMGLKVRASSASDAIRSFREHLANGGYAAAQAVAKAFVLFALVVIAVPVSSILPGGTHWGPFATFYSVLLVTLVVTYALWDRLPEDQKQNRLRVIRTGLARFLPSSARPRY